MDTLAPMILCKDSFHDDGASMWAQDDEGHFKKIGWSLTPFNPLKLSFPRVNPEGIRA